MPTQDELVQEIEAQIGLGAMAGGASPVCIAFIREERLQYRFVQLYQTLVAVLAIAILGLLLAAAWSAFNEEPVAIILSAAGAIATGVAAKFLLDQRKDARTALAAAKKGLQKHCSE